MVIYSPILQRGIAGMSQYAQVKQTRLTDTLDLGTRRTHFRLLESRACSRIPPEHGERAITYLHVDLNQEGYKGRGRGIALCIHGQTPACSTQEDILVIRRLGRGNTRTIRT